MILDRAPDSRFLYVLAHGAGAGMRHPFLEQISQALARQRVATLRYDFPYMEKGGGRPDPPKVLTASVRAAIESARAAAPDLGLIAGGKSLGGRMTSTAASEAPLPGVKGLVFLGFPLHPPGRPGEQRAEHLERVPLPMLFLQGTRDDFAEPALITRVVNRLGDRATLHLVEGGDHSFAVLKRSGRSAPEVIEELAVTIASWADTLGSPKFVP